MLSHSPFKFIFFILISFQEILLKWKRVDGDNFVQGPTFYDEYTYTLNFLTLSLALSLEPRTLIVLITVIALIKLCFLLICFYIYLCCPPGCEFLEI